MLRRLRQFKALGIRQTDLNAAAGVAGAGASAADLQDDDGPHSRLPEPCSIQQRNCEAETLRVFRLITGQVFGRLLEESQPEENDDTSFDDLHYPGAAANAAALANWDQVVLAFHNFSLVLKVIFLSHWAILLQHIRAFTNVFYFEFLFHRSHT